MEQSGILLADKKSGKAIFAQEDGYEGRSRKTSERVFSLQSI